MIIALCFLGTSINCVDRANLSVAAPFISREFSLGPEEMGLLLGAFVWTYAIFQLPGGWFIDKLGPRIMYAFAVAWWSVFTALSAVAVGFGSLFGYRLGLGVGERAAYPANAKVVSRWFPIRERAFATSIYDSGARVGTAVSIPLLAFTIAGLGWWASFVITGVIGFVWVAQVGSIGGIQNFASNLAGIGSPFFLGAMKAVTGSFALPLIITGGVAIVGALAYGVMVGRIELLPVKGAGAPSAAEGERCPHRPPPW